MTIRDYNYGLLSFKFLSLINRNYISSGSGFCHFQMSCQILQTESWLMSLLTLAGNMVK